MSGCIVKLVSRSMRVSHSLGRWEFQCSNTNWRWKTPISLKMCTDFTVIIAIQGTDFTGIIAIQGTNELKNAIPLAWLLSASRLQTRGFYRTVLPFFLLWVKFLFSAGLEPGTSHKPFPTLYHLSQASRASRTGLSSVLSLLLE